MRVQPAPGLTPTVLADGRLELRSELTGESLRCHPSCTAVWIALRQHGGDRAAAADALALAWQVDVGPVRADLDGWVDLLRAAGFVRLGAAAEPPAWVLRHVGPVRRHRPPADS